MFDTVQSIAHEAGALALEHFDRIAEIAVEAKGHLDLVSEADRQVEILVSKRLQEAHGEDGLFGEEGVATDSRSGRTWVIDPIDGTFNFLRGSKDWAVSIGLYENRQPSFGVIYAPARKEFLVGGRSMPGMLNGKPLAMRSGLDRSRAVCSVGFHPSIATGVQLDSLRFIMDEAAMSYRCTGSAITALIDVAKGEVDGFYGMGISSWDLMAIVPILESIGLTTTLDWASIGLAQKLHFACGTPEFIEIFAPRFREQPVSAAHVSG